MRAPSEASATLIDGGKQSQTKVSKTDYQLHKIQKKIEHGKYEEALADLSQYSNSESVRPDVYYMRAVCLRYCRKFDSALRALQLLKEIAPEFGRAYQEEGHTYRALGKESLALKAYERACSLNPALTASFKAQSDLLKQQGQITRAQRIDAQLDRLLNLPKPLVAVTDLISQGKLLRAEELCKDFMRKFPHHVEGMRLLADIAIRLGVLDDAELLLKSAIELEPENSWLRIDFIRVLRKKQQFERALIQAKALLETQPDNLQYRSLYAIECMQSGYFEQALAEFDAILLRLPNDPITSISKGHAMKTHGDSNGAIACYRNAIKADPEKGEAFYSLANLKTYRFTDAELRELVSSTENANLSFIDRVYVHFALGKAYEDKHDIAASFEHYQAGNSMKKTQSRYKPEQMTAELEAQKKVFTRDFVESRSGCGYPAKDPIFILGLPRAGSTLLEQILSSHSDVDGTLELPNVLALSQKLRRESVREVCPGYPFVLEQITGNNFEDFGKTYINETYCHRKGARRFIDKMPNNFRHIGLIKLMLPNAKIVDARRNPMDCCWSGYKQLFAEGQEFTYDLSDIGFYYRDYVNLMEYWETVLPGFILKVNNEDVIDDLEGQVKRILEFCELSFEDSCLNFHNTKRNVRTPSSEQVRRPVNRSGVGQWRPFTEYLSPLRHALGDELVQLSEGAS